jgi:uncharacterized protein YggE
MRTPAFTRIRTAIPTLLFAAISLSSSAQDGLLRRDPDRRTLTVTGTGEVMAAPDQAFVRLGAIAQSEEAGAAQADVSSIVEKAVSAIQKAGIPRRSIRTTGLTLTPVYSSGSSKADRPGEPRIVGYRAANIIEVTSANLELVGKVIDAGLTAGANRLEGVSFSLQDDLPQRTAALTKAVEEASAKAQTMARALDVTLGSVREVIEGGVHILRQEQFAMRGRAMAADGMQTPVEPGEIRIQATVTIHYDLGSGK